MPENPTVKGQRLLAAYRGAQKARRRQGCSCAAGACTTFEVRGSGSLKNLTLPHCRGGGSAVISASYMWAAILVQHVCFPLSLEGFEF